MLGVASAALWAAGCARPEPSADPISRWELDETSSAEGVFEDEGPAHVLMAHAGTWADLTTDSLVEGIAGTSAYTDGSAYATMPADVAAHNLTALTISFYYQRESASEKHILLAAGGSPAQVGDFSIEVLPNGRLRAWHVGQDGVLRFFESTNGVTGTDLQVGTAHRIELTLGPQGARLYLDGAELAAAAIPENTNGWNNSRVKYLGRWTDGIQAPAVGVFDRLRIWNRQLTSAEIAGLAPAQSITLPGEEPGEPGQPGDAPIVPSLAEWLVSDEADPAVTKYVSNQNRGNGSGSSPANAQEVQAALNGASPGHKLLAVCQTPGEIEFWNYPNGLTFPAGSSGNYVTLQARNGDGVVICRSGDLIGARTADSGFWTQSGLSGDDISKHIWRSTSSFSGGEEELWGWWIEFGHPHLLLRAGSMSNLRAPYGQSDSPTNYSGPMVHKDSDGRIYIRMQKPHPVKYSRDNKWSEKQWAWADGGENAISNGQINYPVTQDPNDYPIYLARHASGSIGFSFASGGWAKIGAGINSMGFRWCINRGSHHIWCDRGTHYSWHRFLRGTATGGTITNYFLNRVRCTDGSKRHLSLSEFKFGGWQESYRSACFNMFSSNTMSGVYFKDCTIGDWHEVYTGNISSSVPTQIRLRNCTLVNTFDDGFQARYSMCRVEVGYCLYLNSDWGGNGGGGTDGTAANPNEIYIHHNVIDCRGQRATNWRAQPHPQDCYSPHSPDGNNAYKIYNNLVMTGPDRQEEFGIGFQHSPQGTGGGNNTQNGAASTHQVFNNIILLQEIDAGVRYDPVVTNPDAQYSDNHRNRSDFLGNNVSRYSASHSNELQDYNLYYRDIAVPVNGQFFMQRGAGQTVTEYDDLADWWSSSEFDHSKQSGQRRPAYSDGWEGNSTNTKPTMASLDDWPNNRLQYRPSATSAVTTASSGSLNGQDWWSSDPSWGDEFFGWTISGLGLEPSNFKGPLDPNGSTMPVGVQNP